MKLRNSTYDNHYVHGYRSHGSYTREIILIGATHQAPIAGRKYGNSWALDARHSLMSFHCMFTGSIYLSFDFKIPRAP